MRERNKKERVKDTFQEREFVRKERGRERGKESVNDAETCQVSLIIKVKDSLFWMLICSEVLFFCVFLTE